MAKLNQILAVEKGVKTQANQVLTEAYKLAQKPAAFTGFFKNYTPVREDGEQFPAENNRVQANATQLIRTVETALSEMFDVALAKDAANCFAKADVVVNGKVIAAMVPATHLLFLEKQLTDLKTFLAAVPTLDPSEEWTLDPQAGVFKTGKIRSQRTAKVQEPMVMYPATPEHPAQTQLIVRDVTIGHWETVKTSTALPGDVRAEYVGRVESLLKAVQQAREAANAVEAPSQNIGKAIFDFVFGAKDKS